MAFVGRLMKTCLKRCWPEKYRRYEMGQYVYEHLRPVSLASDLKVPETVIGTAGIAVNLDSQLARLSCWKTKYVELWSALRQDRTINRAGDGVALGSRSPIRNGYYHTPDAEIYAAMIGDTRPEAIVEIGGGFSTLVARATLTRLNIKSRLIVVDPQPRTAVENAADTVIRSRIEDSNGDAIEIPSRSILFIDSSHLFRMRGDLPFLYCQLLPSLAPGTVVHVHDVYLPWDYPSVYGDWLWSEQYFLNCMLAHSPRYCVQLSTYLLARTKLQRMREVFGEGVGPDQGCSGCSFWFDVRH